MKNTWEKELFFPEDVLYSNELLWVKEKNENLRMGICDIAVKAAKKLAYVELDCKEGSQMKKGDKLGEVETSKTVWEIISPISGIITFINPKVVKGSPAAIMDDPYGEGWLFDVEKIGDTDTELKQLYKGDSPKTKEWIEDRVFAIVPLSDDEF